MEATLTPQLDTMLEDMLKRVYSLEQRLTNPSVAVGSGSSPNFVQVTVGNPLGTNEVLSMAISPPSGLVLAPGALYDNIFVDASWTAPVDGTAAEYEVQIARKNGAAYELVMARRSVSNAVRLDGLDPNTTYGIRVYAVNAIGLLSTPLPGVGYTDVTTGVDASIPGQVTGVSATAGATSVMVSWNENTEVDVKNGAGLYEVQRATDAAFSTGLVSGKTSATLVAVTGLTPGTLLYFRVRALDSAGNTGAWSTTVSATPGAVGGSASDGLAPTSSPAATVVSYIGALQINWPVVTNADPVTYEVHLSTASGFTPGAGTKLGEVAGTTYLATVDAAGAALVYGTTYYAKVIAKDKDGAAAAGTQGSGVIRRAADADITTISGAKVKDGSPPSTSPTPTIQSGFGYLVARWAPVANNDPVIYEVHVSATNGFTPGAGTLMAQVDGTYASIRTLQDGSALVNGTTYYVRLIAKDADGAAAAGAQASGTPQAIVSADVTSISGAKVKDGAAPASSPAATVVGGLGYLTAFWPAVANNDPVTYDVHVSATTGFTPNAGTLYASVDATSINIRTLPQSTTPLTYGTTYYVKIVARDADGSAAAGTQGSAAPFQVQTADVGTVSGVKVKDGAAPASSPTPTVVSGVGVLTAFWSPVANNDPVTYDVHLSATNGFTPVAGTLVASVDGTSIVIRNLPQSSTPLAYGTTYYIKIVARDLDGSAAAGGQASGTAAQAGQADIAANSITSAMVVTAGLDATVIKTGFIDANRIQAQTIDATKLIVSIGGGNLLADSGFESPITTNWNTGARSTTIKRTGAQSMVVTRAGGSTVVAEGAGSNIVPLYAGEKVVLSAWVYLTSAMTAKMNLYGQATPYNAVNDLPPVVFNGTLLNQWQRVVATYTVPNSIPYVPRFYSDGGIDGTFYVDDVQLERGDIGTAYAPKPDEILPGTISADRLVAGTLTSASGVFGAIDAGILTTGTINAGRIGAGSITADKLTVASLGVSALLNGSFEEVQAADATLATNWYRAGAPYTGTALLDATSPIAGSKSMKLTTTGTASVYDSGLIASNPNIPVTPGDKWYISCKAKGTAGAVLKALVCNATVAVVTSGIAPTPVTGATATYEGTFTIPAGMQEMFVVFYADWTGTGGSSVWIDDVVLQKVNVSAQIADGAITGPKVVAGAINTEKLSVASLDQNLVRNGSFLDPGATSADFASWRNHSGGAQGIARREVTTDAPGGAWLVLQAIGTDYGRAHSDFFAVNPGDTYTVSCIAGQTGATGKFYFRIGYWSTLPALGIDDLADDGGIGSTDIRGGQTNLPAQIPVSGWERVQAQSTAPAGARFARITIYNWQPATGTMSYICVSDVQVRRVVTSALISDGAITTSKLTVTALNSSGLLANQGFEELGATGGFPAWWLAGSGNNATRITSDYHSGSACMQVTSSGSNALASPVLPCGAGDWMTVGGWAKQTAGTTGLYFRFSWRNSAGAEIGISDPIQNQSVPGAWTFYTGRSQAPAGTVNVQFQIYNVSGTVLVDDLDVRPTLGATQITPGSITTASGLFGTVDASSITTGTFVAARIGADTIDSSKIVTAGLDAAVIKFGTMSGDRIAANSITAAQLTIGSQSDNMVANGSFEDLGTSIDNPDGNGTSFNAARWSGVTSGGANSAYTEPSSRGSGARTAVLYTTGPGVESRITTDYIPVAKSSTYVFSAGTVQTSGAAGGFYMRIYWYKNDKTSSAVLAYADVASNVTLPTSTNIVETTAGHLTSGQLTSPSDAAYCAIRFFNSSPSTSTYMVIDNVQMRPVVGSVQIANGAVTAGKILAGSISSDRIDVSGLDAGHIKFGTMHGDRIQANTLSVNTITTSTLTGRTITLGSGGTILTGSSLSQGFVLNEQGFRLYKAGVPTIILDAISGNATFTGTVNAQAGTFSGSITSTATITGGTITTGTSGQNRITMAGNTINFTPTSNSPYPASISVQNYIPGFESYGQMLTIDGGKTAAYTNNYGTIYVSPGNNGSGGITIQTGPTTSQAGNIYIQSGRNMDIVCPTLTIGDYNQFYQPTFYGSIVLYSNVNNTQPRLVPALDAANDNSRIRMWERRRLTTAMSGVAYIDTSLSWIGYWDTRPVLAGMNTIGGGAVINGVVMASSVNTISATIRNMDVNATVRTTTVNSDVWCVI
jgi:hypothetical protein